MILRTLTLEGVGPYAERQTLEFAAGQGTPVTLIGGLNGSGKTTIIRSLFHVLYGARSLGILGDRRSYGAFLADSIHHGAESASVELDLVVPGLRDGQTLTVRRQWHPGPRGASEDLDVFVAGRYDEELSESWEETIEQIAPLGIARLFFFDGEKIEALADLDSAATTLRTAIGSLLGLDLIEQLRTDLVAVQRRVLRDRTERDTDELERRQAQLDAACAQEIDARRRLELLEDRHRDAHAEHAGWADALRAAGGDLVARREELEQLSTVARERENVGWEQLRTHAANPVAPLALVTDLLSQLEQASEAEERRAASEVVLETLAQRDKWLVGQLRRRKLGQVKEVAALLDEDRARRVSERMSRPPFQPATMPGRLRQISDDLTNWRADVVQCLDSLDEATGVSDQADRSLSKIPSPDSVRELLAGLAQSEGRLVEIDELLIQHRNELATATSQTVRARERREAELARLAATDDSHEREQRIVLHAERAKTTLLELHARIAKRHVSRIEAYASECLELLLRKKGLVERVEIDPTTFAPTLLGSGGRPLRPESLSAGERQLTALALLWALARAAGRPLPVVIDTPLGRLDAGHRRHVVERYLPAASHQVVVLSTDTEIDAPLYAALSPAIGAERRLVSDLAGATTIEPGYLELSPA